MSHLPIYTSLCALLLGLGADAAASTPLTYREALTGAVEANPQLQSASLQADQSEASLKASRGQFDPVFGIDGQVRRSQTRGFFQGFPFDSQSRSWDVGTSLSGTAATGTTFAFNGGLDRNFSRFTTDFGAGLSNESVQDAYTSNLNVSVTQQLMRGIKLSYNVQNVTRARQGRDAARLTGERARQQTLADTAQAYWLWVYQDQLREIAEQSIVVATEALRVGDLQVQAGQLAPVERTRLEAAQVQAQQASLDARHASQEAADQVLLLMGRAPGVDVRPTTSPGEAPAMNIDVDQAVAVAMAQNVDLAVARTQAALAKIEAANARHGLLPTLAATVAAGVGAQDTSAGAALGGIADADAFPFFSVGGRFEVPVGNRSARGEADRSTLIVRQREIEVQEQERAVAAQVRQQVRVLVGAQQRVALADANLGLAAQMLEAEEALAQAGRAIQRNVLEARTELDRTRAEAAKTRNDWRTAQVELLRLQGQLDAGAM